MKDNLYKAEGSSLYIQPVETITKIRVESSIYKVSESPDGKWIIIGEREKPKWTGVKVNIFAAHAADLLAPRL